MRTAIKWMFAFLFIFSVIFNGGKDIYAFTLIQTAILLMIIISLIWIKKNKLYTLKSTPVDLFLLLFAVSVLISTAGSVYLHASLVSMLRIISYIGIFYLIINSLQSEDYQWLGNIIFACCSFIALVGIVQYYSAVTIKATFPNQNMLAGFLMVGISIGISRALTMEYKTAKKIEIMLNIVALMLMIVCLFFTRSRAGVLSLLITSAFLVMMKYKKNGMYVVLSIGIISLILIPESYMLHILKIGRDPYAYKRISIWTSTFKAFLDRPLWGWGPDTFMVFAYRYNFPVSQVIARYGKISNFAHNEFLQLASETGIISLGIFVMIIIKIIKRSVSVVSQYFSGNIMNNGKGKWLILASCAALLGILLQSLVDFNLHLPTIMLVSILFVGFLMGQRPSSSAMTLNKKVLGVIMGVVIALVIMVQAPCMADLFAGRGEKLNKKNMTEDVIASYKKAIFFAPLNSDYYMRLAEIYTDKYAQEQDSELSAKITGLYQKAITVSPHQHQAYYYLANFHYRVLNKASEAVDKYNKAISCNPYNAFMYYELASLYFNEKQYLSAILNYKKAVQTEPYYAAAYFALGLTFEEIEDYEKAFNAYQTALWIKRSNLLSRVHYTSSEYEHRLLKLNYAFVYNRLGLLYVRQGRMEEAVEYYTKGIELDSQYPELYSNLAGAYYAQGLYVEALSMCRKALHFDPNNDNYEKNINLCLKRLK